MKSPGLPATFHSNRSHCPADPQLWVGEQKEGSKTQLSRCVLALSVAGWTPPGHYICSSPAGRVATHRANEQDKGEQPCLGATKAEKASIKQSRNKNGPSLDLEMSLASGLRDEDR